MQELFLKWLETKDDRDFHRLYNQVNPKLILNIKKINSEFYEEACSNAWIKVIKYLNTYNKVKGSFENWIFIISKNELLKIIKKENLYTSFFEGFEQQLAQIPNTEYNTEIDLENAQELIISKIKNLEPIYREALEDRELRKLKYREIAELRELNIKTVSARIRRAREQIKKIVPHLDPNFYED